jgi:lysophospholipase L1-like esterase
MKRRTSMPNLELLEGRSLTAPIAPRATPANRPGPAYLVVCEGNSLTYGTGAAVPASQSYPAQLQARLGQGWKVLNLGIPRQTTEQMLIGYRSSFARVGRVLAQLPNTTHRWTIDVVWEGTNSIRAFGSGQAAALKMRQFVALRHSERFKVIVLTALPGDNPKQVPPEFEAQRRVYNALIRKNVAGADLVVDIASDPRLMDTSSSYFSSDHFHLSQEGYELISALVSQAVARLAKLPPPS